LDPTRACYDDDLADGKVTSMKDGSRLSRQSVQHVRLTLHRVFAQMVRDEVVRQNPISAVRVPNHLKADPKTRACPTDDELMQLWSSEEVDLELKMLTLLARSLGGMRSCDLHRLDWALIDRERFEQCTVVRKGLKRHPLAIPSVLRPLLTRWWHEQGRPTSPIS